jgi:hypothetical protein
MVDMHKRGPSCVVLSNGSHNADIVIVGKLSVGTHGSSVYALYGVMCVKVLPFMVTGRKAAIWLW